MSSLGRQKIYAQKYRAKWQLKEEFKVWLRPHPQDNQKAYCCVCSFVIKAHLFDIKKHGKAKKHTEAVKFIKTFGSFKQDQECNDDIRDSFDSDVGAAPKWTNEGVNLLLDHLFTYWTDFKDGIHKKKNLWCIISVKMKEKGYDFNGKECGKKFRNVKMKYFSLLERKLLGENVSNKIKYFDKLDRLLCDETETRTFLEERKKASQAFALLNHDFDQYHDWNDEMTISLLNILIDFKNQIDQSTKTLDIEVWRSVLEQMKERGHHVSLSQCRDEFEKLIDQFTSYESADNSLSESQDLASLWPTHYHKMCHLFDPHSCEQESDQMEEDSACEAVLDLGELDNARDDASQSMSSEDDDIPNKYPELSNFKSSEKGIEDLHEKGSVLQRLNALEEQVEVLTEQNEQIQHTNELLKLIIQEVFKLNSRIPSNKEEGRKLLAAFYSKDEKL